MPRQRAWTTKHLSSLSHHLPEDSFQAKLYCMQGRVYAPGTVKDEAAEAIREFNEFVIQDERVETVTVPFRDGVSIVQRK